jgi:hypothetical protein
MGRDIPINLKKTDVTHLLQESGIELGRQCARRNQMVRKNGPIPVRERE